MLLMISHVLGLHEPQFYGPGYRPGYYTTAQTPLHRGTGRTRLVSNLVAELKAPRHFFPLFLFLSLALLGGLTTTLFATSWIKESTLHVPSIQRRLGRGVHASDSHLVHNTTMYPPAVHPVNDGTWRLRTTSTMPTIHFASGPLMDNFSGADSNASDPSFVDLFGEASQLPEGDEPQNTS